MRRIGGLEIRCALGCALALGAVGCAPAPPSMKIELPTRQFTVGEFNLPSGLRIIVDEDPQAGAVASALVVGTGAADDPEQLAGLAHLVEHLTFRAHREGQPSLTARLAIYGVGAWNAETTLDSTTYYEVGAAETLPRLLEVAIGRVVDPLQGVTEEQFASERGVVMGELDWRDESGRFQLVESTLRGQLFAPGHAYARAVGGSRESLQRATLEQARAWTREHYLPRITTWVLAGAVSTDTVGRWLEQMLPQSLRDPGPTLRPRRSLAVTQTQPAVDVPPTIRAPVDHPQLLVAWELPPARGKQEPAFQAVTGIVESRASRIEGVNDANGMLRPLDHASILELQLELADGTDPVKVVQELRKTLKDGWTLEGRYAGLLGDLMEQFFVRSRTAALVAVARANESILSRAVSRARRVNASSSAQTLKEQSDALVAVSFYDVMAAGRSYLTPEGLRALVVKPLAGEEREAARRAAEEVPAAFSPEVAPAQYPPEVVARFVRGPGLASVSRFQAVNGLEVVTLPRGPTGLVTVTLAFPGGRRTSTPPGLADRLQWSEQAWGYGAPSSIGAGLSSWWTDDAGFVEYQGSSGNLSNLLAMLSERVMSRHAVDPPKGVTRAKVVDADSARLEQRFWRAVYGSGGQPTRRPAAEAAMLEGKVAQAWLERQLDPTRAVLVVTGDVPSTVQAEVEHWLSRWRRPSTPDPAALPQLPPAPGVLRLVKDPSPGARQVKVLFACTAQGHSAEESLALELLASEIKRQWNVVERETLGSSYGFTSSSSVHRDGSMRLLVGGRVDRSGIRRMAVAVTQTWKGLPEAGAAPARLNRLRWEYGRVFNVSFLGSGALGEAVAEERLRGAPLTSLDEVPAVLMRVGPEHIASVAGQCQRSAVLGLGGDPAVLGVESLLPPGTRELAP